MIGPASSGISYQLRGINYICMQVQLEYYYILMESSQWQIEIISFVISVVYLHVTSVSPITMMGTQM